MYRKVAHFGPTPSGKCYPYFPRSGKCPPVSKEKHRVIFSMHTKKELPRTSSSAQKSTICDGILHELSHSFRSEER